MAQSLPIKEIFTSIQGEGPYIGVKQTFVRVCTCNLNCSYCDTNFSAKDAKTYTTDELAKIINSEDTIHSVALTGGEPLLHTDFLLEFANKTDKKLYLETNATLDKELEQIIDKIDIISADIKLESSSGMKTFARHDKFFEVCKKHNKEVFAKIVFTSKITDAEIEQSIAIAKKYNLLVVLQPAMVGNSFFDTKEAITEIFNKFTQRYDKIRLIPQTHKFLGVE